MFLFRGMVEDDGAVLRTDIRPLTVRCRRVVDTPEEVQQLVVRDDGRIVDDLHHLSVIRAIGADILVRRVL